MIENLSAVILAGGLGTRLSEETVDRPKPMVQVGGQPILWHIMKIYSAFGVRNFVICCGYKGYVIKEYFANYFLHRSDVTIDLAENRLEFHNRQAEPWRVTLVDTGEHSMTGGRLRRVRDHLPDDRPFFFTYGDAVTDLDISKTLAFHQKTRGLATVTSVRPPGRFGSLQTAADGKVEAFIEKPQGDGGWINGGFFVLEKKAIDTIDGDDSIWERAPMETLAARGQMYTYRHDGFWQCMDTLRDKQMLEQMWQGQNAPWKRWA